MKAWMSDKIDKIKPLHFFVIVAAVAGLLFLLITPPLQGADETSHFLRAYQVSEGHFVSTKNGSGKVGGYLPSDLGTVVNRVDGDHIQFNPQLKYREGNTRVALGIPRSSQYSFYQFPGSVSYSPAAYPLSSFGIVVSRILQLPTIVSLYAARLGNLLTWIILMGAAIYFIPYRKWVLVAVGLLPMGLFQASTLNGDAVTVGTLALFLALLLKIRVEGLRVSQRLGILIIVTSILMVLSKQIMCLFLPLILLLPKQSFSSQLRSGLYKGSVILIPLVFFGIWTVASQGVAAAVPAYNHQDPGRQLHFILANPYSYVNVLWNTYFYTWGDSITRSFIGTFGWADTPLSEVITTVGYIGLFLLLAGAYEKRFKEILSRRGKLLLVAAGFLYWLAVSTALYVDYSPVGFKIVVGLQGRYYIPLVILAIPLLRTRKITIDPALYKRIAVCLPLFLLLTSVITLYVRYFIHNV